MVMALHHPGHQRFAREVEDGVMPVWHGGIAVGPDGGDSFALDDDRGITLRLMDTVNQICAAEENASHVRYLRCWGFPHRPRFSSLSDTLPMLSNDAFPADRCKVMKMLMDAESDRL